MVDPRYFAQPSELELWMQVDGLSCVHPECFLETNLLGLVCKSCNMVISNVPISNKSIDLNAQAVLLPAAAVIAQMENYCYKIYFQLADLASKATKKNLAAAASGAASSSTRPSQLSKRNARQANLSLSPSHHDSPSVETLKNTGNLMLLETHAINLAKYPNLNVGLVTVLYDREAKILIARIVSK